MAVYTEVGAEELERFLEQYRVGRARSLKGIAEGVENSNFLVETDLGRFVLTLYEKRVQVDELPFFLGLLEHLARRGVACPQPARLVSGAQWTELNGRPAALLTWLDGVSYREPDPSHCAEAGIALARLHDAGADYPVHRANALSLSGWQALAKTTAAEAGGVKSGLDDLIANSLCDLEREWPTDLPAGIIHADLFPDNVLFLDDRISGLIDFYFACNDFYAYDVAVMLNAWCFDGHGRFDFERGRRLLEAYRSVRPLSQRELDCLPVLAQGAALRFLLTRLHDWLRRDPSALVRPKNPLDYVTRLDFHRSVRDPAAYGV
jgi:homoserine kinase type II